MEICFSDFRHFCRTDATVNDRRLAKADSAFESKPWAGRWVSQPRHLVEPLPFARISLPEIPRVERSEYV